MKLPINATPLLVGLAGGLSLLFAESVMLSDPSRIVSSGREAWFDRILTWSPRVERSDLPLVVDIGRNALVEFGEWPWPRNRIAQLLDKLADGRPKVVAIDILLPFREQTGQDDSQLAQAIARMPTVLGAVLDPEMGESGQTASSIAVMGDVKVPGLMVMNGAVLPSPQIVVNSQGLAILSLPAPEGQPVRAVPLLAAASQNVFPGLAIEALRIGLGAGTIIAATNPQVLRVGDFAIPLLPDAMFRLHFTSEEERMARTLPAEALLNNRIASSKLTGKFILLGASAPEAGGLRLTAVDPFMPSVQIHAEALAQLLTGHFPIRRDWMIWIEAAAALLIGGFAVFAVIALPPGQAVGVILAFCLAIFAAAIGLSVNFLWLTDAIAPAAAVLFAAQCTALVQFALVYRQRISIERRFAQHLSPQVVRRMVENPGELKLAGETRVVTALFTDIESFTALTERVGPEVVVSLLDRYIDTVADLIVAHGGMVDKIVGDAVHAFFNAPLDLPNHAAKAVSCALSIVEATERLRRDPDVSLAQLGRTRIGIETGLAVLGEVGRGTKRDYTAYGRAVNLASRLEAINKTFGTSIALGPGTVAALAGKIPLRRVGSARLAGIENEVEIFEPYVAAPNVPKTELPN